MFRPLPRACALAAFMVYSAGCGGSDEPGTDASATVSCTEDPRLDTYAGELDKPGELGVLSFRFSDLSPTPPAKGSNTFHVQVSDASGGVMEGALDVDLFMPDHGHGTSVEPIISFDAALGQYTVSPLFLFMPGVWRIEFAAHAGADDTSPELDRVVLHFCVEG